MLLKAGKLHLFGRTSEQRLPGEFSRRNRVVGIRCGLSHKFVEGHAEGD